MRILLHDGRGSTRLEQFLDTQQKERIAEYHAAIQNNNNSSLCFFIEVHSEMKCVPVPEANVTLVRAAAQKGDNAELVRLLIMQACN